MSAEDLAVGVLDMLGKRLERSGDTFCILWTLGADESLIKRFLAWLTMAQDPVARTLPTPSVTILEFVSSHAAYHTISPPDPSLERGRALEALGWLSDSTSVSIFSYS